MIPAVFVCIDAIPQTPNGKIDRIHLPAVSRERPTLDVPFAPPVTEAEKELASIWSEVLDLDQIGIHDNFFALGGDSLLATKVVARVIEKLKIELPLTALFESLTVAELTRRISKNQARALAATDRAAS